MVMVLVLVRVMVMITTIGQVATDLEQAEDVRGLRTARTTVAVVAGTAWACSLVIPAFAVYNERWTTFFWAGLLGLVALAVAHLAALWPSLRPEATTRRRERVGGFILAAVLSVPLLGFVGPQDWYTWAWIGGAVAGLAPLVLRGWWLVAALMATGAASAGVGLSTGDSVPAYLLITVSVGAMVAGSSLLPVWLWQLLGQARAGRIAQARLAVSEERLRFARDLHDLLGHRLTVIALKAELAARLATVDPDRSAQESIDIQHLSSTALDEVREAVHGYREVDLAAQLAAVQGVLRSSGIRCTVTGSTAGLPAGTATQLALVLREGCTNVLRHSKARWCTIAIQRDEARVRLTMENDGAKDAAPDRLSHGLRGAADRLADAGGTLRTVRDGSRFVLEVSLAVA
jgi:two-component system sensor histidine kinase DesK